MIVIFYEILFNLVNTLPDVHSSFLFLLTEGNT